MGRAGAVTFKGNPLTLAGEAVAVGQTAPDFVLHAFEDGREWIDRLGDAGAAHQSNPDEILKTVLAKRDSDRRLFRKKRVELVELVEELVALN